MVPAAFVAIDALPLTPNGKLDRSALPDPKSAAEDRERDLASAPQTPTEEVLAKIWRDILRVATIGRLDDFFELGGHSLTALQVVSQVRDVFGIELPLKTLFEARTLEALAGQIDLALLERRHAPRMPPIEAAPGAGPVPLSYSQERMWLIQSLDPANTAYNMAFALRIRGQLDGKALSDALDELSRRHDILRSTVRLANGEPLQEIEPWAGGALEIVDLRAAGIDAASEALRRAEAVARTPFDLASGPVIRANLFRTGHDDHLLSVTLHHIAGDQWSIGVMGREWASLYNNLRRGDPARLEALPISYRDYALWQRSGRLEAEFERQLVVLAPAIGRCCRSWSCRPTVRGRPCRA